MEKNTLFLATLCALLPAAGFAGDCNCVISDNYHPQIVTVSPCQKDFLLDVSAPITCSSPRIATNSVTVRPRTMSQKPFTIPVTLVGKCVHENEKTKDVSVVVEFDDSLKNGDIRYDVSSVDVTLSLGYDSSRHMAGRLQLFVENPTPGIYRQSALRLTSSRLRDIVSIPGGRQFLADQCFAVVTNAGDNAFDAVFYPRNAARMGYIDTVTNGTIRLPSGQIQSVLLPARIFDCYVVDDPNAFKVRYRFSNPSPGSCNALRIVETHSGGRERTIDYTWNGNRWSLVEGGGLRSRVVEYSDLEDGRVCRETVSSSAGGPSFVVERLLREIGGEERVLREVTDPDGLALTNRYEYFETGANAGFVSSEFRHDGSWAEYERLDDGRLSRKRSGWLAGGPEDDCRTIEYSYSPIRFASGEMPEAFPDDDGSVDPTTARVETESIGGVPVSKLLRHVTKDEAGYRRIEEVRLLDPSETNLVAAWTAPVNPHRLSVYMPDSDFKPCSRLPSLVVEPDGSAAFYDYASGEYTPAADGTPGSFAVVRGGSVFRTTITHGTAASFDLDPAGLSTNGYAGVPLRGTREIRYETRIDKLEILRESYVCNATGGYERIAWTKTDRDADGNVVRILASDGTRVDRTWSDGLLLSETDENGIVHSFAYDGLDRLVSDSRVDPLTGETVVEAKSYDAEGRAVAETKTAGSLSQTVTRIYDAAGRIVRETAPSGIATAFEYGVSPDGLSWTRETAAAGTSAETVSETFRYPDGRTARTVRNGRLVQTFSYPVSASEPGIRSVVRYRGSKGTGSPVWAATVNDALDRTIRSVRPGFGGALLVTETGYDGAGRRVSDEEWTVSGTTGLAALLSSSSLPAGASLRSRTFVAYDSFGDAVLQVADADLDDTIGLAGPDVVVSNEVRFAAAEGAWWPESRRWSFPDAGSAAPFLVSTVRERLSGLGGQIATDAGTGLLSAERLTTDECGGTTRLLAVRDREGHAVFEVEEKPDSAVAAFVATVADLPVRSRSSTGVLSTNAFDALGRVVSTTDGRSNAFSLEYDAAGNVVAATDDTGARTEYSYDALGRKTVETNAVGLVTTTVYDFDGNIIAQGGDQHRACLFYDEYGRMCAMTTFRTEDLASGDVTTWHLDEATGLVTNKVFADGSAVSYGYTPEGLLASRAWARGIVTSYGYDGFGNLLSVDYSDATPDVVYAYDRLGRLVSTVADGVSTNLFSYRRDGRLASETQNGLSISRSYDVFGRLIGYSLSDASGAVGAPVAYGYDAVSRVVSVSSGSDRFSYGYLPGTDDIAGMESNFGLSWSRSFEPARDVLTVVSNVFSGRLVSAFAYSTDAAGRRTDRFESGAAFGEPAVEEFDYDHFSQVVGSHRYHADAAGTPISEMTGRAFGYTYDGMGNRLSSAESAGELALETVYSPNALNQYDAILHPGYVTLRGAATNGAIVSVNGVPAESCASAAPFVPWSAALATGDPATGSFLPASVLAVLPEAEGDVQDSAEGFVFAPPAEETLSYDADGNLLSDGRYIYAWDGENRLVSLAERVVPTNRAARTFSFRYDPSGRLVSRVCSDGAATSFRWLDLVVVLEETAVGGSVARTVNLWGVDVSETLGGAAGVGGLLSVSNGSGTFYPTFDGSGNASEYLDRSGDIAAHYEYSPFGETLVREGARADGFAYRFSTKAQVPGVPLYYYGSRFYSPVTGRWFNRDPMEEAGGINLYLACENVPISSFDSFGMVTIRFGDKDRKSRYKGHITGPGYAFDASIGWGAEGSFQKDNSGKWKGSISFSLSAEVGVTAGFTAQYSIRSYDIWGLIGVRAFAGAEIGGKIFVTCEPCEPCSFGGSLEGVIYIGGEGGAFARITKRGKRVGEYGIGATIKGRAGFSGSLTCSGEKCKVDAEVGLLDYQTSYFINLFLFKISWGEKTKSFSDVFKGKTSWKMPTHEFENSLASLVNQ